MSEPTVRPAPVVLPDEESDDGGDSALGESSASSSESMRSSILDYRQENGRTYHRYKDGKYNLPNDDTECERLDLQHHLFLVTLGDKLGLAPPNEPGSKVKNVLDVGTGTGIWAIDFADEHPESKVVGVDLSPIQPSFVPPNVEFYIDDIEEPWSFSYKFDYVHSRMMTFSLKNWPEFTSHVYENLAPGGYFELLEIDLQAKSDDGSYNENSQLYKCTQLLEEATIKIGRPFRDNTKTKDMLRDAGFVDIVETPLLWPTNGWPKEKHYKELGQWNLMNMDTFQGLEALTMAAYSRVLGWSQEEIITFLAGVRKELRDKKVHAYWPVYSTYGRKPE